MCVCIGGASQCLVGSNIYFYVCVFVRIFKGDGGTAVNLMGSHHFLLLCVFLTPRIERLSRSQSQSPCPKGELLRPPVLLTRANLRYDNMISYGLAEKCAFPPRVKKKDLTKQKLQNFQLYWLPCFNRLIPKQKSTLIPEQSIF